MFHCLRAEGQQTAPVGLRFEGKPKGSKQQAWFISCLGRSHISHLLCHPCRGFLTSCRAEFTMFMGLTEAVGGDACSNCPKFWLLDGEHASGENSRHLFQESKVDRSMCRPWTLLAEFSNVGSCTRAAKFQNVKPKGMAQNMTMKSHGWESHFGIAEFHNYGQAQSFGSLNGIATPANLIFTPHRHHQTQDVKWRLQSREPLQQHSVIEADLERIGCKRAAP